MARPSKTYRPTLIRRSEVLQRCGFSNTTLHRLLTKGEFPPPVQVLGRSVAWIEAEVDAWIMERIEASRSHGGTGHV
ncbi:AlpA family transcriptional regulator [Halomonas sp. A11-A]|uniref:helix-turn-helix transcriptional regulator n=1 Tax=Halomonas sp. A11-A TaxID=2183985 RepID=UPI000D718755|nr:AlpA family transcriptional regulator [Halomonas sp. A11-A]PWV72997.1 AlpA family transcriptional regulator [Halomonas sp. A11-A]